MKSMASALPWTVVMAAIAGLIWWMLGRDMTLGRWLFAAVLLGHGLVHLLYLLPEPESSELSWPFDMTDSWAGANLRVLGLVLIAVTIGGFLVSALAAAGVALPIGWWQTAIVVGAVASAAALILFWDPQLILGVGINVVLVWVALSRVWVP